MFRLFLWFFGNSKSPSNLKKRSDKIFDVFTQTQKDCDSLNAVIDGVVSLKEQEIKKLQAEVNDLTDVKTKNTNLSNKISTFINS